MRLFIACIFLLTIFAGGLSAGGFCFAQRRFLSDAEFIDAVTQEAMKGPPSYIAFRPDRNTKTQFIGIPYASNEEFRKDNPNCCRVVSFDHPRDTGPQFTLLDHLRGKAAQLVRAEYRIRWTEDGRFNSGLVTSYFGLTNCGEVNHARDDWWK